MEHTQQQWDDLQLELQRLKQENQSLRTMVAELRGQDVEVEQSLTKSTLPAFEKKKSTSQQISPAFICPHCAPREKSKEQLFSQLQNWSQKLSISLFKKKQPELKLTHSGQLKDSPMKEKEKQDFKTEESMLQKICLFGPNKQASVNMVSKKTLVPHQLYFPKEDPLHALYQSYGYSLYPEMVEVKAIRDKNKSIEIDRMIFRKGLKPTDYKLVIFQNKEEFNLPTNKIRKKWNPFSTIYCVSVDFPDYLFSDKPYQGQVHRAISMIDADTCMSNVDNSTTSEVTEKSPQKNQKMMELGKMESNGFQVPGILRNNSSVSVYGDTSVYRSNFNLSIMSYYPLIDFFCQFLKELINFIKINRIEEHSKSQGGVEDTHKNTDIESIVEQMIKAKDVFRPLYSETIEYGQKFQFNLGQAKFFLDLEESKVKEQLSKDWAYRMLRLLDKQILYEIYCLVMMEESIVFACQNSYILTFMIYLFVGLLIQPFSYPHTIISSVFQLDHLQTPFIAIMGLNKPNSYLQQNEEELIEKMAGKVLIHIKEQQVKIKTKKKQKVPKSQKLKKIFANFYKRSEKLEGTTKKKQILTRQITKAENELVVQLLSQIQAFYQEQLLKYSPNTEIIDSIRRQLVKHNQNLATVSARLIKTIEEYIEKTRKNVERDAVVQMLVQKQIFSVYLTICYDIA